MCGAFLPKLKDSAPHSMARWPCEPSFAVNTCARLTNERREWIVVLVNTFCGAEALADTARTPRADRPSRTCSRVDLNLRRCGISLSSRRAPASHDRARAKPERYARML